METIESFDRVCTSFVSRLFKSAVLADGFNCTQVSMRLSSHLFSQALSLSKDAKGRAMPNRMVLLGGGSVMTAPTLYDFLLFSNSILFIGVSSPKIFLAVVSVRTSVLTSSRAVRGLPCRAG